MRITDERRLSWAWSWLTALVASFQFLTTIPLPFNLQFTDRVFRRSVVFYPLVGGVIGGVIWLAVQLITPWFPLYPTAVVMLCIWVWLTGALHLDGLMDTADGILSYRPRAKMLEIMKDSRVGAMGVIVVVLYLLLKLSLIVSLMDDGLNAKTGALLFCIPIWSRWFMSVSIAGWPYAREFAKDKASAVKVSVESVESVESDSTEKTAVSSNPTGLGASYRGVRLRHVMAGTVVALVLTMGILLGNGFGSASMIYWVGFPFFTGLIGCLIAQYFHSKLGGLTGDTYGALNELLEVVLLLIVVVMM